MVKAIEKQPKKTSLFIFGFDAEITPPTKGDLKIFTLWLNNHSSLKSHPNIKGAIAATLFIREKGTMVFMPRECQALLNRSTTKLEKIIECVEKNFPKQYKAIIKELELLETKSMGDTNEHNSE